MIRGLFQFKIRPLRFIASIAPFLWRYLSSRSPWIIVAALPFVVLGALGVHAFIQRQNPESRKNLLSVYQDLTTAALSENDFAAADLYFQRRRSLAKDPQQETLIFAQELFAAANSESEEQDRALSLMQSIAGEEAKTVSEKTAHLFMADYWDRKADLSHESVVLALRHRMYAEPDNPDPARRFADYIRPLGYPQLAADCLKEFSEDAECLLLLSQCYLDLTDTQGAESALDHAILVLTKQVQNQKSDQKLVIRLSQAWEARGRIMKAFFVLAEAIEYQPDPMLSDHLIARYVRWLSKMPDDERRVQLQQISLALSPMNTEDSQSTDTQQEADSAGADSTKTKTTATLQLSNGEEVAVPQTLARFHNALNSDARLWLIPLLLSSDEFAAGNPSEAIRLLRQTISIRSDHAVACNNLAWILQLEAKNNANFPAEQALQEAFSHADRAVRSSPDTLAFRQTRAVIAAQTDRWDLARRDLQQCVDQDYLLSDTLPLLKTVDRQLTKSNKPE